MEVSEIRIDLPNRQILVDGTATRLTETEIRLLVTLSQVPGRAFTRRELLDRVAGESTPSGERTIDVHVNALRRKLGPFRRCIETVRGTGFRFSPAFADIQPSFVHTS